MNEGWLIFKKKNIHKCDIHISKEEEEVPMAPAEPVLDDSMEEEQPEKESVALLGSC